MRLPITITITGSIWPDYYNYYYYYSGILRSLLLLLLLLLHKSVITITITISNSLATLEGHWYKYWKVSALSSYIEIYDFINSPVSWSSTCVIVHHDQTCRTLVEHLSSIHSVHISTHIKHQQFMVIVNAIKLNCSKCTCTVVHSVIGYSKLYFIYISYFFSI